MKEIYKNMNKENKEMQKSTIIYKNLKAKLTCSASPEQYDVYNRNNALVGYFRLRWGFFRCDYPTCGEETIYTCDCKGDGKFFDNNERQKVLTSAFEAILSKLKKEKNDEDIYRPKIRADP